MSELVLEENYCPIGWSYAKLTDVCLKITDGAHKTPKYIDDGIRFISIANIRPFKFVSDNYIRYISKKEHDEISKSVDPKIDDILLTKIGTLGYAKLVDWNWNFNIFVGLALLRPDKRILFPKFLEAIMNSPQIIKKVIDGANGTGRKTLPLMNLRPIMIPIPPLCEQKKIVEKIEELFSLLHFSEKNLKNIKILLKQYRQSILKSAFNGILVPQVSKDIDVNGNQSENISSDTTELKGINLKKNTLPKGWKLLTLPNIVKQEEYAIKRGPFGGSLKKEIFKKEGYLVYEQFHAINDDFSMARYFIDEEKYHEMKKFKVEPGDMIISCSGVTLGRIAQIPENAKSGIINQALLKISLNPQIIDSTYFKLLFRSDMVQKTIFKISRGTGMPNFPSVKEIKSILFPIPPLKEQKRIVEKIEDSFSLIDKTENLVDSLLSQNYFLKHSILNQAFVGKLITQDSSDEPSEIMLQKLKYEKEELSQKRKSSKRKKNVK